MEGWIRLHRKILDNPIITKDRDYLAVWVYLLLNTTHKEYDVIFQGDRITLKKGQLLTGRKSISDKLDIDESKVQRILKTFEKNNQIKQKTCNKNRLITIVAWDKYQQPIDNKTSLDLSGSDYSDFIDDDKPKKDKPKKETKHKYGKYKHVLLEDTELEKLKASYSNWSELITYLDEYIEMKGYKAKSHYLCIKKWVVDAVNRTNKTVNNTKQTKSYDQRQYDNLDFLYQNV